MEESNEKLFVSYLNTYGTDFSYIRQTPEFTGKTEADLLRLYTGYLQKKAEHVSIRGKESNIKIINKIFKGETRFRAFVETDGSGPRDGAPVLRLDDYRLPFLLKDREYFLKQQLSFIYEIYGLMMSEGIISPEFVEETDPVTCGKGEESDGDGSIPGVSAFRDNPVLSDNMWIPSTAVSKPAPSSAGGNPGSPPRSTPAKDEAASNVNGQPSPQNTGRASSPEDDAAAAASARPSKKKAPHKPVSANTSPKAALRLRSEGKARLEDAKTHAKKNKADPKNIAKSKLIINKKGKAGSTKENIPGGTRAAAGNGGAAGQEDAGAKDSGKTEGSSNARKEEEENLFSDYLSVSRFIGKF